MNNRDVLALLLAVSPLLSYMLGWTGRLPAALASGGLLAGSAYFLGFSSSEAVPAAALMLWALAALGHSIFMSSTPDVSEEDELKLKQARDEAAALERTLRDMKKEFAALGGSEKRALTLYSAVKTLSEAVDMEGAGRQFGKYVKDYFGTSDFAFYVNDLNSNLPELFSAGEMNGFRSWEAVAALAGGDPSRATGVLVSEAGRTALVPVRHGGGAVGVLAMRFQPEAFRGDLISVLASEFSGEVSSSVRRIQLFKQVEWLSQVDGLTGVYRRNALDERIAEEIKRAVAFRTTLGLMIVDIDHFKRVNDGYGHQFGDFVLKKVGAILRTSVYETDFVGRYGGEEFGVVLPRADFAGALRRAEAIRTRIEGEVFSQGLNTVKLTVSIGIAHFPRDASGAAAAAGLIARADAALYRAKESGRNRVIDAAQA